MGKKTTQKTKPFSIRLTNEERLVLQKQACGLPYVNILVRYYSKKEEISDYISAFPYTTPVA